MLLFHATASGPDTASLPAVLLIIVPGAFIQPEAYANLAKGVQVRWWTGPSNWRHSSSHIKTCNSPK